MPYEMVDFVNQNTTYKALFRYGGDADLLKRLIAAGFPVITEKGIYEPLLPENTIQWGGHYALTTGYDDVKKEFTWQDSYIPLPTSVGKNTKTSYDDYISMAGAPSTMSSSLSIRPIMRHSSIRFSVHGPTSTGPPSMPWILPTRRSRVIPSPATTCSLPCSIRSPVMYP
jgi:hypothetical protein